MSDTSRRRRGRGVRRAGIVVLVIVAGWSAAWVLGRSQIVRALDAQVAAMTEQGLQIGFAQRSVDGFPFAYRLRLDDVVLADAASGARAVLPTLSTAVEVTGPTRLTTRLPDRFTLVLPVDPATRSAWPDLPDLLEIEVEAEDLTVVTQGVPGSGGSAQIAAGAVLASHVDADTGFSFAVDLLSPDLTLTMPAAGAPDRPSAELAVRRVDTLLNRRGTAGGTWSVAGEMADIRARGSLTTLDPDAMARLLSGAGGDVARLVVNTGRTTVEAAADGIDPATDGRLSLSVGALNGVFGLSDGQIEARAGATVARLGLDPALPGGPVRGAVEADTVEALYRAPAATSAAMRPLAMQVFVGGAMPDATLWAAVDPSEALPREPVTLEVELTGTGRIRAQGEPGSPAPPVELGSLSVERIAVSGLGARAEATGELAFTRPLQQPRGTLTLRLNGALALIRQLREAGLITQQTVQALATTAALYTRPGDGPDTLLADIDIAPDGVRVNGDRLR